MIKAHRKSITVTLSLCIGAFILQTKAQSSSVPVAYDIDMAKEICMEKALDNLEGIWIYPDDRVTALILRKDKKERISGLEEYTIMVVEGEDCRIPPGTEIGTLYATANDNVYKIELKTEEKNSILGKPESCLATLSKNADALIIKKSKSPFRLRLNLNFNRLMTGFWKIVSMGINKNQSTSQSTEPPVGMVKIYPSYDGNGSKRKSPRYL